MLTVVCMKWGTKFPADYVNVLHYAVSKNINEPFRFVCLTDDAHGLNAGIEARPVPDMGLPEIRRRNGGWQKLALFKPGLVEDASLMLYLDLDVLVMGSLDPFIARARAMRGLHIIREWNRGLGQYLPRALRPDRGGQSSTMVWNPREQHHIYEAFMADPERAYASVPSEQKFVTRTAHALHYLPEDWSISFKQGCVWYYPLNLVFRKIPEPAQARLVIFHGRPLPTDLVPEGNARWGTSHKFGFGPVDWVRRYWLNALAQSGDA